MGSVDDSLADLKPEDSEGEEEDTPTRPPLTSEQEVKMICNSRNNQSLRYLLLYSPV